MPAQPFGPGKAPKPEPWSKSTVSWLCEAFGVTELDAGLQRFLAQGLRYPAEQRDRAVAEFKRRELVVQGKGLPYLLAMIRDGAQQPAAAIVREHDPGGRVNPTREQTEAMLAERRVLDEQAEREKAARGGKAPDLRALLAEAKAREAAKQEPKP